MRIAAAHVLALLSIPGALRADRYQVTISADAPRVARVVATLTPANGEIRLDRDAADTGFLFGWATFLGSFAVEDATGNPIATEFELPGRWSLNPPAPGSVTVRYQVLLQHDRFPSEPGYDELAYANDQGVFWTGRALFVEGAASSEVEVDFSLPEGWRAVTPWELGGNGLSFRPADTDALLDSGFVAGTHDVSTLDGRIQVVVSGANAVGQKETILKLVDRYSESFTKLFAAPPSGRLLLVAADGDYWGGGVVGSTISMILGGPVDDAMLPTLSFVTVHELFHLWNAAFPIAPGDVPELYWLSEGSATYYAYRAGWGLGDLDQATLLSAFAEESRKARGVDGGPSLAAAGRSKLEQYDRVYSGGLMATIALDLSIRERSHGAHSLDEVMRALYAMRQAPGSPKVSLETLPDEIRAVTGVDVHDLLTCCVSGLEPLSLERILGGAGIAVEDLGNAGLRWRRADDATSTEETLWAGLAVWSVAASPTE